MRRPIRCPVSAVFSSDEAADNLERSLAIPFCAMVVDWIVQARFLR